MKCEMERVVSIVIEIKGMEKWRKTSLVLAMQSVHCYKSGDLKEVLCYTNISFVFSDSI